MVRKFAWNAMVQVSTETGIARIAKVTDAYAANGATETESLIKEPIERL